jgi:DNA-binding transcriptional MerR regulator
VTLTEQPSTGLTVEAVSDRTGISVRNLRFYTTRGLVPPPAKNGRTAVYAAEHVARFELLQELQSHGLTLAAIERYFEGIPADATTEQIALRRATLRPLAASEPAHLTHKELETRAGAALSDTVLDQPISLGAVTVLEDGTFQVNENRLRSSLHMIEIGVPTSLAVACDEVYKRHSRAMAAELEALFRNELWPAYKAGEISAEQMVAMVDDWDQGGVVFLIDAFTAAVTDARREIVEKRSS